MESSVSSTEVAARIFAGVAKRDLSVLESEAHPDVVEDFVAVGEFRGVSAVREFFAELYAAMPDFDLQVVKMLDAGDHAVVQWRATGTFIGTPFQGVHATGRRVELRGCDVMRIEAGRLVHNTVYYDGLAFARQIGLLPTEGSTADRAMTAAFNATTDLRARLRERFGRRV